MAEKWKVLKILDFVTCILWQWCSREAMNQIHNSRFMLERIYKLVDIFFGKSVGRDVVNPSSPPTASPTQLCRTPHAKLHCRRLNQGRRRMNPFPVLGWLWLGERDVGDGGGGRVILSFLKNCSCRRPKNHKIGLHLACDHQKGPNYKKKIKK